MDTKLCACGLADAPCKVHYLSWKCRVHLDFAFSYAAFDNRKEVTIRDVRKAIQTTKLIYPDVIKKELVRFNTVFKDVYLMETKQILKDEV